MPERISQLLQRSDIGTTEKGKLATICGSNEPLHEKTTLIYWQARQTNGASAALKELLSLTEDEYLGSQL